MHHSLKCWTESMESLLDLSKTYEVRWDDRGFNVGDILVLTEYDPNTDAYGDRVASFNVTHITRGPEWGLPEGLVVMAVEFVGYDGTTRSSNPSSSPDAKGGRDS